MHPVNPRYFTDDGRRVVYPTGAHTWNNFIVRTVRDYERTKPKQHPVGLTGWNAGEANELLFDSDAEWISLSGHVPGRADLWSEPRAADGHKVSLLDTDHLRGEGGDYRWIWKSFRRGHQPLYMDRIAVFSHDRRGDIPGAEDTRRAMGAVRRLTGRLDLAGLTPHGEFASSGYCLARAGRVEGGAMRSFTPPIPGDSVVHSDAGARPVRARIALRKAFSSAHKARPCTR